MLRFSFTKEKRPPAPLLLLFRKKVRLAHLLACKCPRNGSLSLPLSCGDAPSAHFGISDAFKFGRLLHVAMAFAAVIPPKLGRDFCSCVIAPFRKKARSAHLLGCKRPRDGLLSLFSCGLHAYGAICDKQEVQIWQVTLHRSKQRCRSFSARKSDCTFKQQTSHLLHSVVCSRFASIFYDDWGRCLGIFSTGDSMLEQDSISYLLKPCFRRRTIFYCCSSSTKKHVYYGPTLENRVSCSCRTATLLCL